MLVFTGCAEETTFAEIGKGLVPESAGELEFRDPPPEEDCNCYMSILSVDDPPTGENAIWGFIDGTFDPIYSDYFIDGYQNKWVRNFVQYDFPTPLEELDSPSYGDRTFILGVPLVDPDEGFTLHTIVKCISTDFPTGHPYNTRTYYHSFRFGDGTFNPLDPRTAYFEVEFDCWRAQCNCEQ